MQCYINYIHIITTNTHLITIQLITNKIHTKLIHFIEKKFKTVNSLLSVELGDTQTADD